MGNAKRFKPFSRIIGQEKAVGFLKQVMAGRKIPHSYLFTGISGVGKTTTAVAFTQAINCHEPVNGEGCGQCRSCRQIISENFTDLIHIEPDGQNIKIGQVRDLNRSLSFKPVSGMYRVCIIHHAEMMNDEAANSFLKTLEEPPPGNILVLKVVEPLDLLPTIVSRCQQIPFRPLPSHAIAEWLVTEMDIDKEKAAKSARISEGSLGKAIDICNTDFLREREDAILRLIQLPDLTLDKVLEMAVEYTGKNKKGVDVSGRRDAGLSELLGIWKTWYRDLILVKIKGPADLLINADFSIKLKNLSKRFKTENLIDSFLLVDQAQRDLTRNPNLGLMMENTVLALKKLSSPSL